MAHTWAAEGEAAAGSSAAPSASASASAGGGPLPWLKSGAAGLISPSVKSYQDRESMSMAPCQIGCWSLPLQGDGVGVWTS